MRSVTSVFIAVCLLTPACGETTPSDEDGHAGMPIPGSYDLALGKVTVSSRYDAGPAPLETVSPSDEASMRLDIRGSATSGFEALLTPRWGTPARFIVATAENELRLKGDGATISGVSNGSVTDSWSELRIPWNPATGVRGPVGMVGREMVVAGDIAWDFDLATSASLANDATPSESRSAPISPRGPNDALLPWDAIEIDFAEGIGAEQVASHLTITSADVTGQAVGATWEVTPDGAATNWAGVVRASGRLAAFPGLGGPRVRSYVAHASSGILDPSGLASSDMTSPFSVLDPGASQASFSMDDPRAPLPVAWGSVAFHGVGTKELTMCEHGGCAYVGPFNGQWCESERHGLAGVVQAPTGRVSVRYRLLFVDTLQPESMPHPWSTAFTIEIATAGGRPVAEEVRQPADGQLEDLGAGVEMRWAAPWATATVSLPGSTPPSVIDLGFAVSSADATAMWCGGGPLPTPVKTLLLVDSVRGE